MATGYSTQTLTDAESRTKGRNHGLYNLVITLVQPYRKWLFVIFSAMLLETLMSLAAPWPLKIIIDQVIGKNPLPLALSWLDGTIVTRSYKTMAAASAITLIVFAALGSIASYINSYYTESVAQHIANDLRQRMYHHLQRLSLAYYDSHQIAQILNTITADVSTIQDFASQSILRMIVDAMTIIGMLCIMFYLQWDFALVAVGITPFLLLFVIRFKREVKKATREVRKDQSVMAAVMQQGLESMRSINAFGRQDMEEERLHKVSLETMAAALRARRLKALLGPVVSICVAACVALVLWRGAGLVISGVMTVGALTVFLAYLNKFFSPVQDIAKMTNIVAQTGVALERIQVILDADSIIPEKPGAIVPDKLYGNIVFDKVGFSYVEGVPVLHDFTLEISKGQWIGICGPSGGGKSTVAGLIARFYDPTQGSIRIDNQDIRDFTIESLRKQIGFVLQDTFIFFGTVRENIAYGRPGVGEAEIVQAAKMAKAHDFIMRMPGGYDTIVGERGITLSGGQRQCIGIARAIVRNAPILILDEPTASLDTESEKIVIDALEQLMQGRTVITIAHRLSTIRHADKIVVLKGGCVAEAGTHDELLLKKGAYYDLYQLQTGTVQVFNTELRPYGKLKNINP
jgi:ABC-type multidrug transport system fused ATPase/permease subunit